MALLTISPLVLAPCARGDCESDAYRVIFDAKRRPTRWNEVHTAYLRFRDCDDGAIAEWYSDNVVHLLARRQADIAGLSKVVQGDKQFGSWLLGHIDSTCDSLELVRAAENSKTQCPNHNASFCGRIRAAAEKALHNL